MGECFLKLSQIVLVLEGTPTTTVSCIVFCFLTGRGSAGRQWCILTATHGSLSSHLDPQSCCPEPSIWMAFMEQTILACCCICLRSCFLYNFKFMMFTTYRLHIYNEIPAPFYFFLLGLKSVPFVVTYCIYCLPLHLAYKFYLSVFLHFPNSTWKLTLSLCPWQNSFHPCSWDALSSQVGAIILVSHTRFLKIKILFQIPMCVAWPLLSFKINSLHLEKARKISPLGFRVVVRKFRMFGVVSLIPVKIRHGEERMVLALVVCCIVLSPWPHLLQLVGSHWGIMISSAWGCNPTAFTPFTTAVSLDFILWPMARSVCCSAAASDSFTLQS